MGSRKFPHAANPLVVKLVSLLGILEGVSAFFAQKALHFAVSGKDNVPRAASSPAFARYVHKGQGSQSPDPQLKRGEVIMFVSGVIHLIGSLALPEALQKLRSTPEREGRSAPMDAVWLPRIWTSTYLSTLTEVVESSAQTIGSILGMGGQGTGVEGRVELLYRAQKDFLEHLAAELKSLH